MARGVKELYLDAPAGPGRCCLAERSLERVEQMGSDRLPDPLLVALSRDTSSRADPPSPALPKRGRAPAKGDEGQGPLTDEDLRLLAEIASGATNDVAARRLGMSPRVLRRRLRTVCDRLGVTTPIEAVVWAARRLLI